MAKYTPNQNLSGDWVKKAELKSGQTCKIVNETTPKQSSFKDKNDNPIMQDVAKVHFDGQKEPVNCNLNKPTINALIDAFGEESTDWIDKELTVETENVRISGKSSIALYLVPDGYHKIDDEGGYAVIVKKNDVEVVNFELSTAQSKQIQRDASDRSIPINEYIEKIFIRAASNAKAMNEARYRDQNAEAHSAIANDYNQ